MHPKEQAHVAASETWLAQTAQRWKVVVFLVWLVGFGTWLNAMLLLNVWLTDEHALAKIVGATVGGLFSFLWLWAAVRCSECGARVAWLVLRTATVGEWFRVLWTLKACPRCHERVAGQRLFATWRNHS